ncbi:MAG: class I SAM-dependent methyltransferase [Proteobacteria bacterium]|nr:class I SAM-dependent methyltransferase [Pseudomonadota bacterium]
MENEEIVEFNRTAWNRQVELKNQWTVPVDREVIRAARKGEWDVLLTPGISVPREWFPPLSGCGVLCLASGGGQQGPVLAAAGADVVVLDNSPRQLERDRVVAGRESLNIETVQGDMADLSMFSGGSFDLVFHPVSNCFVSDVKPVWLEAFRVLRPGGILLAGFSNPVRYLIDWDLAERTGDLHAKHPLPYSDAESLSEEEKKRYQDKGDPLEFSHSLEDQIGGQLKAGFVLTGLFEDAFPEGENDPFTDYLPTFIATRALKPPSS